MGREGAGPFVEAVELPPHALLRKAGGDLPGIGGRVHGPRYDRPKAAFALAATVNEMAHPSRVAETGSPLRVEILVISIFEPAPGPLDAILPEKDADRRSIGRHSAPAPACIFQAHAELCEGVRLGPYPRHRSPFSRPPFDDIPSRARAMQDWVRTKSRRHEGAEDRLRSSWTGRLLALALACQAVTKSGLEGPRPESVAVA